MRTRRSWPVVDSRSAGKISAIPTKYKTVMLPHRSSLTHAAVMGYQAVHGMIPHGELNGVAVLVVIGVVLLDRKSVV